MKRKQVKAVSKTEAEVKKLLRKQLKPALSRMLFQEKGEGKESDHDCCEANGSDPIVITFSGNRQQVTMFAAQTCGIAYHWVVVVERRGFFKFGNIVGSAFTFGFCRTPVKTVVHYNRQRGRHYYVMTQAVDCCGKKTPIHFYVV